MVIFDALVAGYLRHHGARAFVTVVAVALGVSVYLAVRLASAHAVATFGAATSLFADESDFDIVRPGRGFDGAFLMRVRRAPGIARAMPAIDGTVVASGDVLHIEGVDLLAPLPRAFEFRTLLPGPFEPAGSGPPPYETIVERGAIVSTAFAERHRLHVGERFAVSIGRRRSDLLVSALAPRAATGLDRDTIVVDLATAQTFFDEAGRFDRIACVADAGALDRARRSVASVAPPGAEIVSAGERRREIERALGAFTSNLAALGALALVVAAFFAYEAIAISVVQRRGDIGTLRALGTRRGAIARAFLTEGIVLGCIGALLGVAGGTLLASLAGATPAPNDLYTFDRTAPLVAFGLGVALATLAAVIPAREAARLRPTIARSHRPLGTAVARATSGYARAACVSVAIACVALLTLDRADAVSFAAVAAAAWISAAACGAPLLLSLAHRVARYVAAHLRPAAALGLANLASAPRRLAATVTTLALGVSLATAVAIFGASLRSSLVTYAGDSLPGDLIATPLGGAHDGARPAFDSVSLARVAAIRGIAHIEGTRTRTVRDGETTIDVRSTSRATARSEREPFDATIDAALAARKSWRTGAPFALPAGDRTRRFRVSRIVDGNPLGTGSIALDPATFARVFGDANPDALSIFATPGIDLEGLRKRVTTALGAQPVDVRTTRDMRASVLARIDVVVRETLGLAGLAALAGVLGIANAMSALVLERRDEIRLVRYAGLSRAGVYEMVLVEAAALGALGGALGFTLGAALAWTLLASDRASAGWLVHAVVPARLPLVVLAASIVVAIGAALGPARLAARLPMHGSRALAFGALLILACVTHAGAAPLASDPASTRDVWRVLGHLRTMDGGHVDLALTFFRYVERGPRGAVVVFASTSSVLDEERRVLRTATRVERAGFAAASSQSKLDVRVDEWRLAEDGDRHARERSFTLSFRDGGTALGLHMRTRGALARLGPNAFVRTGSCASCSVRDVALPRVHARGTWKDGSRTQNVAGDVWLERESGGARLGPHDAGWDRFTISFADGRSLLVRVVRHVGTAMPSVDGAFVAPDGVVTLLGARDIDVYNPLRTTWRNSRGASYPSLWGIVVRKFGLDCAVVPELQNQEADYARGARYYQGSVDVERADPGPRDDGRGYAELTGYDGPFAF